MNDSTSPFRHGSPGGMKYTNLAVSPVDHCAAGQFGSVVTAQHRQISAALSGQTVEFGHEVLAGDAAFDHSTEAFAGVLVMIETILTGRPSVVESNWKSTAHTRLAHIRDHRQWRGRGAAAFSAPTLRHSQPFFAPRR